MGYADDENDQHRDREIAIEKQPEVHEGILRGKGVDEEHIKCRYADNSLDQNFEGGEPVELGTPVQKHLQRGNSEAQAAKSEPVELRRRADRRLLYEERYAG